MREGVTHFHCGHARFLGYIGKGAIPIVVTQNAFAMLLTYKSGKPSNRSRQPPHPAGTAATQSGSKNVREDLHLPNPVMRSHYSHGFIKRDHLLLRTESATNDVTDYAVHKSIDHLPQLQPKLSAIVDH